MELGNIWGVGVKTASDLIKQGFSTVKDLQERGTFV
jgi:nucleotidyltransferase/DNA polymerase involved in DNA repair